MSIGVKLGWFLLYSSFFTLSTLSPVSSIFVLGYRWLGIHFFLPLNLWEFLSPQISDLYFLSSEDLPSIQSKMGEIFVVYWIALECTTIRNLCQV